MKTPSFFLGSPVWVIARITALGLINAFAVWFVISLLDNEAWLLAFLVSVITIGLDIAFLSEKLYAYRWFTPGLVLMILMLIYPTIFTVYIAFTNYSTLNLLTPGQARQIFEQRTFLAGETRYDYTAFRSADDPNLYGLWLRPRGDAESEPLFAAEAAAIIPAGEVDLGGNELDEDGVPLGLAEWTRVPNNERFSLLADPEFINATYGEGDEAINFNPQGQLGQFEAKYTFNDDGTLTDNETGDVYTPVDGTFTNEAGEVLAPGYYVVTGLDNFERLVTDERIREPFLRVFLWTIAYAFLSVFTTFAMGLFVAILLNAGFMPGRALLRTLLLVPYTIPAFISVLVWRGLLNEQLGVISKGLADIGVDSPPWFSDPVWAKVGILFIQLWLGYPYMMLICSGALQSIPRDIYSAAEVDGANALQQFRFLTLPLLLVAVGPLLIASFAYNFNNFALVELYNEGGPPIPGGGAAGHTDILITYTFSLAFGSGRGADYGFASTITLAIFAIVAVITVFNFRLTGSWEEISENV